MPWSRVRAFDGELNRVFPTEAGGISASSAFASALSLNKSAARRSAVVDLDTPWRFEPRYDAKKKVFSRTTAAEIGVEIVAVHCGSGNPFANRSAPVPL
jgi:ABC-type glycerol-3-phosphate transport system substrate-binding protein